MENLIGTKQRHGKYKRVTLEECKQIRADYVNGMTWVEIQNKYERSPTIIHQILKGIHPLQQA